MKTKNVTSLLNLQMSNNWITQQQATTTHSFHI